MSSAADENTTRAQLSSLALGLPLDPLPPPQSPDPSVPHAPARTARLSPKEKRLALANALRYFPSHLHATLAPEFCAELNTYNHIYMYRLRPTHFAMKAYPVQWYPTKSIHAAAIIHMIMNNLNPDVAQFPHELVTYGGNGAVFSNWAQFHIVMQYLCTMGEDQTLHLFSGHPHGLFPTAPSAPRMIITNGMVIPNYSSKEDFDRMYAMGVSQFGQMTAGSFCYIGPQGIVHGTTLTVLNAGRKYLGSADLSGKVYVTSGLGGMSGAQAKAAVICGAIGVVAEVSEAALSKRHNQGWVTERASDLEDCIARIKSARADKRAVSIAYLGNVVTLWERLVQEPEMIVELGSDQTSLHNPYNGGYYPVQISFDEANEMMVKDPPKFKELVQESLRRHVAAVNALCARGMRFWDYGNSFLLEASRANADVMNSDGDGFRYPSYVEDIMGDIFSLGFGPFRWVCTSGEAADLALTDRLAADVTLACSRDASERSQQQFSDNHLWITKAEEHKMVVGSQARILYSNADGRTAIALAFNEAVADGRLHGPVVLSRDHHDVSGTDSPFRETSNIRDGSMFCADMAVHNFVGDAFHGATYCILFLSAFFSSFFFL
eukprot:TRINITY_DN6431_c0_g1_i6.p1 TRINITY_DN6431_c0_g1~~TRINITY_DN6431_c0_g1_i6.p1  ORF type:complete len:606 (+),score=138.36 TRINITY_DN6431_c0_g1_i6:113-1930(+)